MEGRRARSGPRRVEKYWWRSREPSTLGVADEAGRVEAPEGVLHLLPRELRQLSEESGQNDRALVLDRLDPHDSDAYALLVRHVQNARLQERMPKARY